MADELSYYQDRVLAESTIETATQRLSVVRHARLVDYEPAPATAATTVLQLDVAAPPASSPPATGWMIDTHTPLLIRALGADGSIVDFEIEDPAVGLAGARQHRPARLGDRRHPLEPGRPPALLLGRQPALPARGLDRFLCRRRSPRAVSRPATAARHTRGGQRRSSGPGTGHGLGDGGDVRPPDRRPSPHSPDAHFPPGRHHQRPRPEQHRGRGEHRPGRPGPAPERDVHDPRPRDARRRGRWSSASGRTGRRRTRCPITATASRPARWPGSPRQARTTRSPRCPRSSSARSPPTAAQAARRRGCSSTGCSTPGPPTRCLRLRPSSTRRCSPATARPGSTTTATAARRSASAMGPSECPRCPARSSACFTAWAAARSATYPRTRSRTSRRDQAQGSLISACTNPFPATGGADAETIAQVRNRAPQKFSAEPLRVVLAGDYVAAAQSLPWVQQAVTAFRWTGSWLTVLTRADPAGIEEPTIAQLESLTELLDQRAAGRLRELRPPPALRLDRSADHGQRATRLLRERRGGRRARSPAARGALRRRGRVLRPLTAGASASRWSRARCSPPSSRARVSTACAGSSTASAASSWTGCRCPRRSRSPPMRSCASTTTRAGRRPDRCG